MQTQAMQKKQPASFNSKSDYVSLFLNAWLGYPGNAGMFTFEAEGNVFRFKRDGEYLPDCAIVYDRRSKEVEDMLANWRSSGDYGEIKSTMLVDAGKLADVGTWMSAVARSIQLELGAIRQGYVRSYEVVEYRMDYDRNILWISVGDYLFKICAFVDDTYYVDNKAIFSYLQSHVGYDCDESDIVRLKLKNGLLVVELNGVDHDTLLWPETFNRIYGLEWTL